MNTLPWSIIPMLSLSWSLFEWRLFRSSGRPWQAKVNFLIGSCIKVANSTLVSKKMCICPKYCIFYSSVLFFQGCPHQKTYRSHVGLASSVNKKKAKWQLILAPLIYNVSSYTKVFIRKWNVLFFSKQDRLFPWLKLGSPVSALPFT